MTSHNEGQATPNEQSAHTPWHFVRINGGTKYEVLDAGNGLVAVTDDNHVELVTVAPELMEALSLLLHQVEESGLTGAKDYGWQKAILKTRIALSKARGAK